MQHHPTWAQALRRRQGWLTPLVSFMLPLLLWCLVSYLPFI